MFKSPCAAPPIQGLLGGVKVKNLKSGEVTDLPISGLFFAIGAGIAIFGSVGHRMIQECLLVSHMNIALT